MWRAVDRRLFQPIRTETVAPSEASRSRLKCLAELARQAAPDERARLERLLSLVLRASPAERVTWERTVEIVTRAAARRSPSSKCPG
ncbi:hypothetical protein [Skermanella stibiiresistens]|nr:hypothetical protein [Skermanella stibiiresistens]